MAAKNLKTLKVGKIKGIQCNVYNKSQSVKVGGYLGAFRYNQSVIPMNMTLGNHAAT
jgi:hypothetical protein